MENSKLNINKTKYRYLLDNIKLRGTAITYALPVDKEPLEVDGELNRDYPSVKISYKKLVKMIDKTAKSLVAIGVKRDDIVVICSSSVPETIYIDYALNKIGAIPSYIYPSVTPDEMHHYFKEADAKFVYMLDTPEIRTNVIKALMNTNVEKIIASTVIESFPKVFKSIANQKSKKIKQIPCEKIIDWNRFMMLGDSINNDIEAEYIPKSICSLVHTSGTSSLPKAVMDTNENINTVVKNHILEKSYVDYTQGAISTIPLFVEFGKLIAHMVLSANGNLIITAEYNPKNLTGLIKKFKPITFETTPSHARELLKCKSLEELSYVKMACFGGDGFDTIENSIAEYFKNNNSDAVIINGYGATEVTAAAISNTIIKHKTGSIGIPLGETEVGLFEPNTFNQITNPNVIGELAVTGDTVTLGYYKDKEETAKIYIKHPDGKIWVHMGDLASYDDEGFYYYHGRIKNVIIRQTLKFAPKEIEDLILTNKNVNQCVIIGKYDEEEGQVPSAHIVLNNNDDIEKTVKEIIELVNARVQEFHRPTVYKIKSLIVTTRNNKININALKIEDIATIPDGIHDAEISLSNDTEYDYDLKVYCDDKMNEQEVIDFIEQTAKNEKVLNGKIKYEFVVGQGKNYYRYI